MLDTAGWLNSRHRRDSASVASIYSNIQSSKLLAFAEQKGCIVNGGKLLSDKGTEGSWSYLAGLVGGYFDSDGTVAFDREKGSSVRILSSQVGNLEKLQVILGVFGIWSKIYNERLPAGRRLLPDGHGGQAYYECLATHELVVSKDNIVEFSKRIPILNMDKASKIRSIVDSYVRGPYQTKFLDYVMDISKVEGIHPVYDCSVYNSHAFDANGIYAHNCFEIGFIPVTDDGVCGTQMCNLSSINGAKIKTFGDFMEASRAAAIIGTLQAAYTNFKYLSNASKKLTDDEALLGVSITGMMDNPAILHSPEYQRMAAQVAVKTNEEWARKIGIKKAARVTCIKPEGTSSIVLCSASGIHPHHAKRYFRRIQCNKLDNVYRYFKKHNPHMCEESLHSANHTDDVVTFPVIAPEGAMTKEDLTALKHLEIIKSTQVNWVLAGGTDANKKKITHNVSCTVVVKDNEWEQVIDYLFENRQYFAAVALISDMGDKMYKQAPMEKVCEEDEARWNDLVSRYKAVDYKQLREDDDNTSLMATVACAGGQCEVIYA